jgi:riboflavin kinase/FMN adenylyltransferase
MTGVVAPGAQRGQELGWRTANLAVPPDRVAPADGVYAAVAVWNQRRCDAVAYIGTRPTFGAGERLLEVHLFDDVPDLYGHHMTVEFVDRVRLDMQFSGADALSRQIARDVDSVRIMLQKYREVLGK